MRRINEGSTPGYFNKKARPAFEKPGRSAPGPLCEKKRKPKEMKTTDEIADFILHRIGNIYFRPLMYGGTADGVEVLLNSYHELWAEIFEKQDEYKEVSYKIHSRQKCGAMNFTHRFRNLHPNADPEAICTYVVKHWRKISKELGMLIPYEELRNFFKDNEKISQLFEMTN